MNLQNIGTALIVGILATVGNYIFNAPQQSASALDAVKSQIAIIDKTVTSAQGEIGKLNSQINSHEVLNDKTFDAVNKRLDSIDKKLDQLLGWYRPAIQ